MSSTTDVVNTAIAGVVTLKILDMGMDIINKPTKKGKKLKKIKTNKWL